jgi:hypothetical protein
VATPGLDFFRVDRSGSVRRLLAGAGVLVTVGASLIGGHLVHRLGEDTGHGVSLTGGLIVLVGLILGFGGMAMLLFENVYLLIEPDGLVCHENGKETRIPWADLDAVRLEGNSGFVVLARRDGAPLRWFAGKSAKDVSLRVEEAKRKALHGLLRAD